MALLADLPFYLPAAVFGLVAGVVFAILTLFYRREMNKARNLAIHATGRATTAEAMLATVPIGCFSISYADQRSRCSGTIAAALGLDRREADNLSRMLSTLREQDAQRLDDAISRLHSEGERFEMMVSRKDGQANFKVTGEQARNSAKAVFADLLWFQDISSIAQHMAVSERERGRLAGLLDTLPVPIWQRDRDLNLTYCNRSYATAVGLPQAEVLSKGVELLGSAQGDVSRGLAERARGGSASVSENHHVVAAGSRRLLEIREHPLPDGSLAGLALDLTPVEELRGELSRHADAHAEVLENLATAIAIFGPDMRLAFFNAAYAQLWGLDESWLVSEPNLGDIYEKLRERRRMPEQADFPRYKRETIQRFQSLIEPVEELIHLPDGSTLRMMAAPHPFGGVLFTYEDVTDRLALERSYNTMIDVQRETLNNLYEGIAVFGSNGQLRLSNPAFNKMWGLKAEMVAERPHVRELVVQIKEYFHTSPSEWPKLAERIVAKATEPEARSGRLDRIDGAVFDWAQVPLPNGDNLFTYLDVTDTTHVERALRERNEALETADRLKSEFIANISYELRTPLNAIVGFAEILENQFFGDLNERQLEYSKAIVESSQRLITLINDILDLSTIEAGYLHLEPSKVDIFELLQSVESLGRERARDRDVNLVLDCPDQTGSVLLDERRMKQALFNLVSNALKFTPQGGTVTIAARRKQDALFLSVIDNGIGIAPEEQSKVFGKFERGSQAGRHSGAGLGLSLVKCLIELHGGRVELQSVPNKGTRVTCYLPIRAGVAAKDATQVPTASAQPAGVGKVAS